MKYKNIIKGKFISRPNRFIAEVEINGIVERVHVKNTGRCRELLVSGATVYLEDFADRMGKRKMRYSLIGVIKETSAGNIMINMDSQAPNYVVREAFENGKIQLPGFGKASCIKWEHKYGDSRIDFYLENHKGSKAIAEVKGVTLEEDGVVKFPDAPTERGIKHINELVKACEDGYEAAIIFVIQMKGVSCFKPNDETHKAFGEALRNAARRGVHILAWDCSVTSDQLEIDEPVRVILN